MAARSGPFLSAKEAADAPLAEGRLSGGAFLSETGTSLLHSAVVRAAQSVGFAENFRTFRAWETTWEILPATCERSRG